MADLRRLGLGWAAVLRVLAGTAAGLYFALELGNPVLVSLQLLAVVAQVQVARTKIRQG
jgi:hypothetical protein